jgi:hypothetical protein
VHVFLQASGVSRHAWMGLAAGAGVAAAAVAGALFASGSTDSPREARGPRGSGSGRAFSLPLALSSSSLTLAKHEGNLLVGLAARPGGPVEVAALRAEAPVAVDELEIEAGGGRPKVESCGHGCSRVGARVLSGSPVRLSVTAGPWRVSFTLPARLPPRGDDVLARAARTMDRLHSFRFTEQLSSGGETVETKLEVQAPNRLRLRTAGGFRSVIIGRDRWDNSGGRWEHVVFPGIDVAGVLMWSRARHPRVVGRRGDGVIELAAFGLQPVPAWFRLAVNRSGQVLEAEMIAPSHFMVHRYSDYNGGVSITPPVRR